MPKFALVYRTQDLRDKVLDAIRADLIGEATSTTVDIPPGADPETPKGAYLLAVLKVTSADLVKIVEKVRKVERENGNARLGHSSLVERCLIAEDFSALKVETFQPAGPPGLRMAPAVALSLPLRARAFPVPFRG